jgi:tape measure domain-containing protein
LERTGATASEDDAMSIELADLVTKFSGDTRGVDHAFREVESKTESHVRKVNQELGKIGQGFSVDSGSSSGLSGFISQLGNLSEIIQGIPVLGSAASAAFKSAFNPVADLVRRGFDFDSLMEKSQISFSVIMGGADKAKAHMEELIKFAQETPFDLPQVIQGSRRLQAMGFSAKEVIPALRDIGDAASAMGGGADVLDGIVTALGQMRTKGKLASEEMLQLAERGIPAWQILSDMTGKTVAQLQKLTQQGKLSGGVASELIQQGFRQRYGGLMEQMGGTREVLESNFNDTLNRRAGEGLKPSFEEYKRAVLLGTQTLGSDAAKSFSDSLAKNSGFIIKGMESIIFGIAGGNITQTFTKLGHDAMESVGIGAGTVSDAIKKAGGEVGGMLEQGLRDSLGMHSPSTVMIGLGFDAALSFYTGFQDGFQKWAKEIDKAGGADFIKAVEAMAKRLGASFSGIMNVMAFESGFNPANKNPTSTASGLIQWLEKTAKGQGVTTKQLRGMSAIEQLPYVEQYFQGYKNRGFNLETTGQVYGAVAGPGARDDNSVIYRRGSKEYAANKIWDENRDGVIIAGELAKLAERKGGFSGYTTGNPMPVTIVGSAVPYGYVPTGNMQMTTQRDIVGGAGDGIPSGALNGLNQSITSILPPARRFLQTSEELDALMSRSLVPGFTGWGDAVNTVAMDELPPLLKGIKAVNQALGQTPEQLKANLARLQSVGGLKDRLKAQYGDITGVKSQIKDLFVSLPGIGGQAFGQAFSTWEGGFKGMLQRMGLALTQSLQDWAQQMLASQITRLLTSFLGSLLGGGGHYVTAIHGGGGSGLLPGIPLPTWLSRTAAPAGASPDFAARTFAPNFAYAGNAQPQVIHHHTHVYNFNVQNEGGRLPASSERQMAAHFKGIAERHWRE